MKEQNKILPISKTEDLSLWKKEINKAATDYASNHKDGEVRRMFGHHFRTFVDGAIWEKERQSSLQPTIEELQKENDSLRKQLHDHNGMCSKMLSDQLKEVMPDIEAKSKRIKELEEGLCEVMKSIYHDDEEKLIDKIQALLKS